MDQTISLTAYEAMLRNVSVKAVAIAGETPTVGAGAAGVFVDIYLLNHPITDAHGADKGCKGNTSISITAGGTTLVNEVSATKLDSEMANGDYWVNYLTGKIHCKKGDSGTSLTVGYSVFAALTNIEVDTVTVSENLATVGGAAITLGQKTSANSLPVVLPSDAAANSGSASSGDNTYMSPFDFTVAYASATTLTITPPATFTPGIAEYVSVKIQDTSGVSKTYTPDVYAFSLSGATLTVANATFTATDTFIVTVLGPGKKGVYNSVAPTLTNGQYAPTQFDSLGNTQGNLMTAIAGEDFVNNVMKVEEQMTYAGITAAAPTTTVVKSGAGLLHCLQINKAVATGVITIYDNTAASGAVIATITQPAAVLATTQQLLYDVKFTTGLTIVTSTAAQDITVSYR